MAIKQEIYLGAPTEKVYELLTSSRKFSQMSGGAPADISREPGGAVLLFGGAIAARNIELVPDELVVQAWRSADWPAGIHSIVQFSLAPADGGTMLSFSQAGHPEESEMHLKEGWEKMYWAPMKAALRRPQA